MRVYINVLRDLAPDLLRETQREAIPLIEKNGEIQKSHDVEEMPIITMPCGTGKTWILFLWAGLIGYKPTSPRGKVLIITFRVDHVYQLINDHRDMIQQFAQIYKQKHPQYALDYCKNAVSMALGSIGMLRTPYDIKEVFENNRIICVNAQAVQNINPKYLRKLRAVGIDECQWASTGGITDLLNRIRASYIGKRTAPLFSPLQSRKEHKLMLFGISATPNHRSDKRSVGGYENDKGFNQLKNRPKFFAVGSEIESIQRGETRPPILAVLGNKTNSHYPETSNNQKLLLMLDLAIKRIIEVSDYSSNDFKDHRLVLIKIKGIDNVERLVNNINHLKYSRHSGDFNTSTNSDDESIIRAVAFHSRLRSEDRKFIRKKLQVGRDIDIVVVDDMLNDAYNNSRISVVCITNTQSGTQLQYQIYARAIRPTNGRFNLLGDCEYQNKETAMIFTFEDNNNLINHFNNRAPQDSLFRKTVFQTKPKSGTIFKDEEMEDSSEENGKGSKSSDTDDLPEVPHTEDEAEDSNTEDETGKDDMNDEDVDGSNDSEVIGSDESDFSKAGTDNSDRDLLLKNQDEEVEDEENNAVDVNTVEKHETLLHTTKEAMVCKYQCRVPGSTPLTFNFGFEMQYCDEIPTFVRPKIKETKQKQDSEMDVTSTDPDADDEEGRAITPISNQVKLLFDLCIEVII